MGGDHSVYRYASYPSQHLHTNEQSASDARTWIRFGAYPSAQSWSRRIAFYEATCDLLDFVFMQKAVVFLIYRLAYADGELK